MQSRVPIRALNTGVIGLDEVLGGGIPEYSMTLIAGAPGSGKTTLGHQIMFANASPTQRAIYFTIIGEPPLKALRYQQQFTFFDAEKVGESVRFVHLGQVADSGGLDGVLDRIAKEVTETNPALVVVDSFRNMVRQALGANGELEVQHFMQRLALHLTTCEATTLLISEYGDGESDGAVFTVADGIVWLSQAVERNSMVRKLQVHKMRGQAQIPGLQTMRITGEGVRVFPRMAKPEEVPGGGRPLEQVRLKTGIPTLDEMTGGGIPRGYALLIAGPSGSGKTVLANQFILEGSESGESSVIAVFEKRPNDYLRSTAHGEAFERLIERKELEILYLRPLDLSIDETLTALREAVVRVGAKRVAIDSLSGLELALAPTFRDDFRESLYRMVGALTSMGVTVVCTVELPDTYTSLQFSPQGIAFLTDAIIIQRYFEIDGALRRALTVVKVRGSQHSKDLREYEINKEGFIVVGAALRGYEGLLSGTPMNLEEHDALSRSGS